MKAGKRFRETDHEVHRIKRLSFLTGANGLLPIFSVEVFAKFQTGV